jgi:hypothetical protein
MEKPSFTHEEVRVLKELNSGAFYGTDPATVRDLALRGFIRADRKGNVVITGTGRVALRKSAG